MQPHLVYLFSSIAAVVIPGSSPSIAAILHIVLFAFFVFS